ncbi:unnamed protein product [Eruca vesicaria subsp. sativa]|uniref:Legume lectin domain-containing protein n=1 Tax=Eruca vesicaria subsp. sativa TaxID=29727 RepID=A0ABC8J6R9_ERUVS|nr:unnamed protein product [Eruca vesicaria subsp. sativa]
MAGVLRSLSFWILVQVFSLVLAQDGTQFVHYNFSKADLHRDGMATIDDGLLHLTNNTNKSTGHAFHKIPMNFTRICLCDVSFARRRSGTSFCGISLAGPQSLTLIQALKQLIDSYNHVGIDVNSIVSVESANASYFSETDRKNISFPLASGKSILVWIDYDGVEKLLNVTLAPVPTKPTSPLLSRSIKPSVPLLSKFINVSEIFSETMFVGFSGSTGTVKSDQYILAWSFKKGGQAESLDLSKVLDAPNPPPPPSGSNDSYMKLILVATIPSIAFLMMLGGIFYLYKRRKYAEVLEQWEQDYIPQRYSFKNLYKETKGFKENQLLGAGGNFKAEEVKMLLKIGMLCSQSNPENRPSMRLIVQYLEGNVTVPSISYDTSGFGMPNISNEMVTQLTATSSLANFSFEDVTVLFGGR